MKLALLSGVVLLALQDPSPAPLPAALPQPARISLSQLRPLSPRRKRAIMRRPGQTAHRSLRPSPLSISSLNEHSDTTCADVHAFQTPRPTSTVLAPLAALALKELTWTFQGTFKELTLDLSETWGRFRD